MYLGDGEMKVIKFVFEIFKAYPRFLLRMALLMTITGTLSTGSLLTIAPIIDFYLHPDLVGISPLTEEAIKVLEFFHLDVSLASWLAIFLSAIFLNSFFIVLLHHAVLLTKYAVLRDLLFGTLEDFFHAKWQFFSGHKQGTIMNTFLRELQVVGNAFSAIAFSFSTLFQVAFYLAVPFYISWKVTCLSIAIASVFSLPFLWLGKLSYRFGTLNTETANVNSTTIQENFNLIKVILGFGNQQESIKNLNASYNAHYDATIKSQVLGMAIPALYKPFGMAMVVISLFTAQWANVPLSETSVLLIVLLQACTQAGTFLQYKNSLDNFLPSYEHIKEFRRQAIQQKQVSGGRNFTGFQDKIGLNGVTFSYAEGVPVLRDIHLNIEKGKMIALTGKSGSGKSTLIDLIMGFHEPKNGSIEIDGVRLQEFDVYSYRSKIGYVPQDSVLFNMSLRRNMLWANPHATDQEIIDACRLANAEDFINAFPMQYETLVGDRGVRLSGGQLQRMALARALLRKPELLILDEATSSLDSQSELLIQQAIENIAKNTTVIVIAHRLSTIKNADCIFLLEQGCIVETGSYEDLILNKGQFNSMVHFQELEVNS